MNPRSKKLSVLLATSGIKPLKRPDGDPEISGVALDSRNIKSGDLFIAIRGFASDGEAFVPQALARGARAVVAASPRPEALDPRVAWVEVEQPRQAAGRLSREIYERPDEALTLVGITGTNGKTTVAYMVQSIAGAAARNAGRIGTTGYAYGGIEETSSRTTPEAPDLYRLLHEMRQNAVDFVALEISSHALALWRVEGVHFTTAAFLNLGRDHLDFHRDAEDYFQAKARLFSGLGPQQHAVLPADTEYGQRLRQMTRAQIVTFGRNPDADVRLLEEHTGLDGSSAVLTTPLGTFPVRSFLFGRFNLENVAAAAACAVSLGLPAESIASGILALERVPGRVERVQRGQPFVVVVDYAHTPEALRNVLDGSRGSTRGALRVVFGCGGDRDRDKRFEMGRAAAQAADRIYVTSDNPRSEDAQAIVDAVGRGVLSVDRGSERCSLIVDRRAAIEAALRDARAGDVVVIAGKGHETTQTIGESTRPFNDRLVAAEVLAQLGWDGGARA